MSVIRRRYLLLLILFCALGNLSMVPWRNYGLLTDSYGIVTDGDLRKEAEIAFPAPIEIGEPSAFNVWQCFPTNEISVECDPNYGEDDEGDLTWGTIIHVRHEGHLLDFLPRRPWGREYCFETLERWKWILQNQDVACICGSYMDDELSIDSASSLARHSFWQLERLKSHVGKWSYFLESTEFRK